MTNKYRTFFPKPCLCFFERLKQNQRFPLYNCYFYTNDSAMDLKAEKNYDHNKLLLSDLNQLFAAVKQGGGKKRLEKIRAQGKMTARERVQTLIDPNVDLMQVSLSLKSAPWILPLDVGPNRPTGRILRAEDFMAQEADQ